LSWNHTIGCGRAKKCPQCVLRSTATDHGCPLSLRNQLRRLIAVFTTHPATDVHTLLYSGMHIDMRSGDTGGKPVITGWPHWYDPLAKLWGCGLEQSGDLFLSCPITDVYSYWWLCHGPHSM